MFQLNQLPNWDKLDPNTTQTRLLNEKSRFVSAWGEARTGKTEICCRKLILALQGLGENFAYIFPNQWLAVNAGMRRVLGMLPEGFAKQMCQQDMLLESSTGSKLYIIYRLDQLEGIQYGGIIVDDACHYPSNFFNHRILPVLSHKAGWCWLTGRLDPSGDNYKSCMQFTGLPLTANYHLDTYRDI